MRAKERSTGEWLKGWKRKRWPSEILCDRIFVPADWTPLPKCRDCGEPTYLAETGLSDRVAVMCTANPAECTRSRVARSYAEAVKNYPKGGE